jgi:hypothetical protein
LKEWQTRAVKCAVLAWLALCGAAHAQSLAELKKIISDELLYPRDARYTLNAALPSDGVDKVKNAEWLSVADRLGKARLIRITQASGKTLVDGLEQSLDVVVPSMNLRYETTALNIVLGRWDIEVAKAAPAGDTTVVQGRRRLIQRTRAYGVVVESLPAAEAAKYSDQDIVWEVSRRGASYQVVEKSR